MKTIKQTYIMTAPLDLVWHAFVEPEIIDQWGGGPAKMTAQVGNQFSLWGGDIHGVNTKVVDKQLLEQDWYSGHNWKQPSKVSFRFSTDHDKTLVELVHSGVPDEESKDIEQGWEDYYLGPIQELLEGPDA